MRIPALFIYYFGKRRKMEYCVRHILHTAYSPEGVYAACNATANGEIRSFYAIFPTSN